jgi:sigma-B regulation protein RsbU (phosphoserine phosphatase)
MSCMLYDAVAMFLADNQLTANEVLRVFHRDEPYLFLGAAFTTVSVLALAFCAIRRRFDPLLVWLAVFAHLYGERLWLDAGLLRLAVPSSEFFNRLTAVVDFLVPIPAFLFFQAAGFLGRHGKRITMVLILAFSALVFATAFFGDLRIFHLVNNVTIIGCMLVMMALLLRRSGDRDFAVVRVGLFTFAILALVDNTVRSAKVEPYGFAVLLGCLGYVAARRTLKRDEELGEIHKELELARRIQLSLLPPPFPESLAFHVAARYVPMNSVAGDLYDVLVADATRAGLLIADVSGHGVPAALIASMVKMAAISQRALAAEPGRLLTGMNGALFGNTQGQYVTAACVHFDANSRELRYAAAGHPAMLLMRGGSVREIAENGLLLAAVDGIEYRDRTIPIEAGDRFLLYTDGLVEARNRAGELFGDESLTNLLKATAALTPAQAASEIVDQVKQWSHFQDDDLTVLVCDYTGALDPPE